MNRKNNFSSKNLKLNSLSANPTKWSNTLKELVGCCQWFQEWFQANKLSLNEDKTRFTLSHKFRDRDNLLLQLSVLTLSWRRQSKSMDWFYMTTVSVIKKLNINNNKIKRSSSITWVGVIVDEQLNWKDHINIIENKLSKNLSLLHKPKQFLNAKATKNL